MSFTSGKFSHDPMPYVNGYGSRLDTEAVYLGGLRLTNTYSPRPEYDHHNPILVALREEALDIEDLYADTFSAGDPYSHSSVRRATPEHIDHARRVLTKLAVLA